MSFDFHEATALFGGSFHPPHLGHTQALQGLLRDPGVKRIVILPSFGTPLKKVSVSFQNRLEMTELAFAGIPEAKVSDFEFRHRTEYTWQLLSQYSSQVKNPVFVIGTDQFQKLEQWARFPDVLGMSDWIVLLRKPTTLGSLQEWIERFTQNRILRPTGNDHEFVILTGGTGKRMKFVPTEAMEISSTGLREKMALNEWQAIETLIAPSVKEYILRNKLYGK